MKNLAFIVDLSSDEYDHGTTVKLWQDFLFSEAGGNWDRDQILSLIHPSKDELVKAVSDAKELDYAFVVIFGKHELVKGELPWAENCIVTSSFSIKQDELCPNSTRTTILYDSSPPVQYDVPIPRKSVSVPDEWEVALENSEMGVVTITAPDASASFSEKLIAAVLNWHRSGSGILTIPQAIELLDPTNFDVDSASRIYNGGRRRNHFPLAVG